MSKIICDICGTIYPDNATACPICGYPRQDNDKTAQAGAAAAVGTQSVKGGRFSNKNVKKRNSAPAEPPRRTGNQRPVRQNSTYRQEEQNPNKSLKGVAIVLLIAVILVGAYIGWRFWDGKDAYTNSTVPPIGTNPPETSGQVQTTVGTEPAGTGMPCVSMTVSNPEIVFQSVGRGWLLDVKVQPEDTTDEIVFASSDESVATVTAEGRITSVGPGTAIITITCGNIVQECVVNCTFGEETTEPAETTQPAQTTEPEETTEPTEETQPVTKGLVLDRTDVSLFAAGENFTFGVRYDGAYVNPNKVTWTTSDANVATVVEGKVTAVAPGTATITATYNGKTAKCVIRCRFEEPVETTEPADTNWKINKTDVTIKVGESFTLKVTNDAGQVADAKWAASRDGVVTINGNQITGKAVGTVNVTMTVNGEEFTCIVRVVG